MESKIKTILVADDNSATLTVLKTVLAGNDFDVITATSGEEADKLIQANRFELLVLGNQLRPGPLGLELCEKYSGDIPVIIIGGGEIQTASYAAGAAAFIPRPVMPDQIMAVIEPLNDQFRLTT